MAVGEENSSSPGSWSESGVGAALWEQTDLTRGPGSTRSTALPEAATQPVIAL